MPGMRLGAVIAAALGLAACSSDTGRKEAGGAAVGGAGLGNRAAVVPMGPGSDTLLGDRAGAKVDDEDKRRASVAELQALETGPSGAPVAWRNPETGRYGMWCPARFTRRMASLAANTPTQCIQTAARRPSMAPPAAGPMGLGLASADLSLNTASSGPSPTALHAGFRRVPAHFA